MWIPPGLRNSLKFNPVLVPSQDFASRIRNSFTSHLIADLWCWVILIYKHVQGVCKCFNKYFMSGEQCLLKVNECLTGTHNCHQYATCHDTLEGFNCNCLQGYADLSANSDGTSCQHPYLSNHGSCNLKVRCFENLNKNIIVAGEL